MDKQEIVKQCLENPLVTNDFPFDDEVMVFRVFGKIFALINIKSIDCVVSLKCDPELAIILRAEYKGVIPGYHLSKKHWNSVDAKSDVSDEKIKEMIKHSCAMVVKGLTREQKKKIEASIQAVSTY